MKVPIKSPQGLPWLLLAATLTVFLLAACSSSGTDSLSAVQSGSAPGPLSGLPEIPFDLPLDHGTAAIEVTMQDGADAFAMSTGAVVSGTELAITAGPGALEWGMWQFAPGAGTLTGVLAAINISAGDQVWIGIANYGTMSWQLQGPYPAAGASQFDNLGAGDYTSPLGENCYFIVGAYNSTTVNVASVEFSVDMPTVVTYTTDIAPLMTTYCTGCHDAATPSAGIPLTTYQEVSSAATAVQTAISDDSMPLGSPKMTAAEKQLFSDWITGGKVE